MHASIQGVPHSGVQCTAGHGGHGRYLPQPVLGTLTYCQVSFHQEATAIVFPTVKSGEVYEICLGVLLVFRTKHRLLGRKPDCTDKLSA